MGPGAEEDSKRKIPWQRFAESSDLAGLRAHPALPEVLERWGMTKLVEMFMEDDKVRLVLQCVAGQTVDVSLSSIIQRKACGKCVRLRKAKTNG